MKRKIEGVDMDAAIKYMVANDCRLDEAIAAVSSNEQVEKTEVKSKSETRPASKPHRVVKDSFTTEKPKTRLKAARLKSGLSQSQLAEKADLNLRTLQAYEQGSKTFDNARLETILKVALACGSQYDELIENPAILELIKKYRETW